MLEKIYRIYGDDTMAKKIEIQDIEIDKIYPNKWNPNTMSERTFEHLKAEYQRVGYLQPILVRRVGDKYEIIDGEHRWRAGVELGFKKLKCIIVDFDEKTAKLTTINMNHIKGIEDPFKLSELIKDLNTVIDTDELSKILDMDKLELQSLLGLLNLSETSLPNDTQKRDRYIVCPKCQEKIYLDT